MFFMQVLGKKIIHRSTTSGKANIVFTEHICRKKCGFPLTNLYLPFLVVLLHPISGRPTEIRIHRRSANGILTHHNCHFRIAPNSPFHAFFSKVLQFQAIFRRRTEAKLGPHYKRIIVGRLASAKRKRLIPSENCPRLKLRVRLPVVAAFQPLSVMCAGIILHNRHNAMFLHCRERFHFAKYSTEITRFVRLRTQQKIYRFRFQNFFQRIMPSSEYRIAGIIHGHRVSVICADEFTMPNKFLCPAAKRY